MGPTASREGRLHVNGADRLRADFLNHVWPYNVNLFLEPGDPGQVALTRVARHHHQRLLASARFCHRFRNPEADLPQAHGGNHMYGLLLERGPPPHPGWPGHLPFPYTTIPHPPPLSVEALAALSDLLTPGRRLVCTAGPRDLGEQDPPLPRPTCPLPNVWLAPGAAVQVVRMGLRMWSIFLGRVPMHSLVLLDAPALWDARGLFNGLGDLQEALVNAPRGGLGLRRGVRPRSGT